MREEFERWYLQVVKGHPNNLTKDESGGYKYLGAMYLGWEAATLIEREACKRKLLIDLWDALPWHEATGDTAGSLRAMIMLSEVGDEIRARSNAELTCRSGHACEGPR